MVRSKRFQNRGIVLFSLFAFINFYALCQPVIDVWYGDNQSFGHNGKPQNYANILGDVSGPFSISILQYSLNGDPNVSLETGPDGKRLESSGDFNIDIAWDDLVDGNNLVVVRAVDSNGSETAKNITIDFNSVNLCPLPYTADWNQANSIAELSQVIDGNWAIVDGNLRTIVPGYDRLIGLGDVSWRDYEITAPFTIHSLNGGGVGFILRWTGHTDNPISGWQPKSGYLPLGEIAWYRSGRIELWQYGPSKSMTIPAEVPYIYKARVETLTDGNTVYSMKVWPADDNEPSAWDINSEPQTADLADGAPVLIVHESDVTIGKVEIKPLGINNISVDVNDTNAVITWQTALPSDSNVAYGLTSEYTDSVTDSNLVVNHNIELTNLTPNTSYHYMITSEDTNGILSQSGDLIFTTTGPDISGIDSDDFSSQVLDANIWTFVDHVGDCNYELVGTGTNDAWLSIHVPAGTDHDPHTSGNRAGRIVQEANNVNFEIEAKFESDLTTNHQIEGLVIQQEDVNDWIRFDLHSRDGGVWLYSSVYEDLSQILNPLYSEITDPCMNPNGNPIWLKTKREGNHWTMWYSNDGSVWTYATDFYYSFNVDTVGVMAGNAGSNPAFTCNVDYFFNTDSPIVPEDANGDQPPVLDQIGDQEVTAGEILDVNIHASDPCGQSLYFTAYDLPGFADFNDFGDGNSLLHLEPNMNDAGTYQVAIRVTDACGLFDEESFQISVISPNEASGIVSDDFHTGVLDANIWTYFDPIGDCNYYFTGAGTEDAWVHINIPADVEHQMHETVVAPHFYQSVNDVNFEVEVKFESPITLQYQEQGIVVKEDNDHFMRFEFFSSETNANVYVRWYGPGAPSSPVKHVSLDPCDPAQSYMRVKRENDLWTHYYSYDANTWNESISFTHEINVSSVGFYGGNAVGGGSPAHVAKVDYFFNMASPIIDEDPLSDSDGDGYLDDVDNCPGVFNPDQNDIDTDGFGDLCDNCPQTNNPDQNDVDSDEIGDICDNCPDNSNPDQSDIDADDVGDLCDNCLNDPNPDQNDIDTDAIGDICDNCPEISNSGQDDSDSDDIGDECECEQANLNDSIDWIVDFQDLSILAGNWTQESSSGDTNWDGTVDIIDLAQICQWWLSDCQP